jgi:hypothetical protein
MDSPFSHDYAEARDKFRAGVTAAGAEIETFLLDHRGPNDLDLTTDTAWVGPRDARAVLVTVSGTHGVEGFFGSAVQVEWLRRSKAAVLAGEVAALHIHAINPYGFSWLRRTNEDNVDINRNWMDFDGPLPVNPAYDEISKDLCPSDWSATTQKETWQRLQGWIDRHGFAAFQKAVSGGQWTHASGLFYGGRSASWSRNTLTSIATANLARASRICLLDFHTGLGPYGYAEPIIGQPRTDPAFVLRGDQRGQPHGASRPLAARHRRRGRARMRHPAHTRGRPGAQGRCLAPCARRSVRRHSQAHQAHDSCSLPQ